MPAPYRVTVGPDLVDYNQHLNEGAYGVIFSDATDHVLGELGLGSEYRRLQGGAFYTVETHTRFLREVAEATTVEVTTQILGVDDKRLHLWHVMCPLHGGGEAATQESLLVHVDTASRSVRPIGEALSPAAALVISDYPEGAGRAIRPLVR